MGSSVTPLQLAQHRPLLLRSSLRASRARIAKAVTTLTNAPMAVDVTAKHGTSECSERSAKPSGKPPQQKDASKCLVFVLFCCAKS
mmetsp:Transcript_94987/g.268305  ORF Transcript_94987/g.268305 Transcript_94987/m.268305 type:complete len:86 (-) Transcript_94987:422-679(-)